MLPRINGDDNNLNGRVQVAAFKSRKQCGCNYVMANKIGMTKGQNDV